MPARDPETGQYVSSDGASHEKYAMNRNINISTGEIKEGEAATGSVNVPVDIRDNEVFRIYDVSYARSTYSAGYVLNNGRLVVGTEDAVDQVDFDSFFSNDFGDFLFAMEWDVYADKPEGLDSRDIRAYNPIGAAETGFVDYPLHEIHWSGDNTGSNTDVHIWADINFWGEVVEVSEQYNLDLLRSSISSYL